MTNAINEGYGLGFDISSKDVPYLSIVKNTPDGVVVVNAIQGERVRELYRELILKEGETT